MVSVQQSCHIYNAVQSNQLYSNTDISVKHWSVSLLGYDIV